MVLLPQRSFNSALQQCSFNSAPLMILQWLCFDNNALLAPGHCCWLNQKFSVHSWPHTHETIRGVCSTIASSLKMVNVCTLPDLGSLASYQHIWINVCMSIHFVPFSLRVLLVWHVWTFHAPCIEATNVAICSLLRRYDSPLSTHALHHKSVYIFRKTKMVDDHLWIFATCYSAGAYFCTSFPLGYSTVDSPGAWEIWWRFSNGRMRN